MKLLFKGKDGGAESAVTGYWLVEIKSLFSVAILKFEGKSREAFHTHAFNSVSWLLKGTLIEYFQDNYKPLNVFFPSLKPILTKREDFHKVSSLGTSWIITFRGSWVSHWKERTQADGTYTLTNGRIRLPK